MLRLVVLVLLVLLLLLLLLLMLLKLLMPCRDSGRGSGGSGGGGGLLIGGWCLLRRRPPPSRRPLGSVVRLHILEANGGQPQTHAEGTTLAQLALHVDVVAAHERRQLFGDAQPQAYAYASNTHAHTHIYTTPLVTYIVMGAV
jgi:hypothetical protein